MDSWAGWAALCIAGAGAGFVARARGSAGRQLQLIAVAALAVVTALALHAFMGRSPVGGHSSGMRWIAGALALAGGISVTRASRGWSVASAVAKGGSSVDAVIDSARDGAWVAVTGRIDSAQEVVSPGGVICAAYDAQLKTSGEDRVSLPVAHERASADVLMLCGAHAKLPVRAPRQLVARREVRRCQLARVEALSGAVPAEGSPPVDALSFESVARLGEAFVAIGALEKDAAGRWTLSEKSEPVLVGTRSLREATRAFRMRALAAFALSLGLMIAAAFIFARVQ